MPDVKKPRKRSPGESLRRQGFDETTCDRSTGYYRPRCSCCEAMVIQGIACHERGCSNIPRPKRSWEDDE
jgi:hypothetical protein